MTTKAAVPSTVTVGPFTYRVTLDRDELQKATIDARSSLFGWSSEREMVIGVDPDQAPPTMRDTTLHEVLHQVLNHAGLASEWGGEMTEQVIRRITPWLLGVIRSNPKLIAFLVSA